jgi:transcriptional regulator with XRE-family HTH domain
MPADQSLCHAIRTLRERAGFTQQQLASAAECTASLISRVERGEITDLSWSTVRELAKALGVTPNDFLAPEAAQTAALPPDLATLANSVQRLVDQRQREQKQQSIKPRPRGRPKKTKARPTTA